MSSVVIQKDFRKSLQLATTIEAPEEKGFENLSALSKIGAYNSKTYKAIKKDKEVYERRKTTFALQQELLVLEAKYPNYRLINLSNVLKLMKKYELCMSEIAHYTNEIPEINQKNIVAYIDQKIPKRQGQVSLGDVLSGIRCSDYHNDPSLFMVAPRRFFLGSLVNVENLLFQIEKPKLSWKWEMPKFQTDPIVLCPIDVVNSKEPYFHIVDAWDVEANDPKVSKKIAKTTSDN